MTSYERKIMDAFEAVSKENGGQGASAFEAVSKENGDQGASATEVTEYMRKHGTISPMDTVIDIADIMQTMGERGYFTK